MTGRLKKQERLKKPQSASGTSIKSKTFERMSDVMFVDTESPDEDWVKVDKGELKGMTISIDRNSGLVVSLSARRCQDANRWNSMPSLDEHQSLKMLDLHKMRYMKELNASVCNLVHLEKLILTRCESLTCLPKEIGMLRNLKEVSMNSQMDVHHQQCH